MADVGPDCWFPLDLHCRCILPVLSSLSPTRRPPRPEPRPFTPFPLRPTVAALFLFCSRRLAQSPKQPRHQKTALVPVPDPVAAMLCAALHKEHLSLQSCTGIARMRRVTRSSRGTTAEALAHTSSHPLTTVFVRTLRETHGIHEDACKEASALMVAVGANHMTSSYAPTILRGRSHPSSTGNLGHARAAIISNGMHRLCESIIPHTLLNCIFFTRQGYAHSIVQIVDALHSPLRPN